MAEQQKIEIAALGAKQPLVGNNIYDPGSIQIMLDSIHPLLCPITAHIRMEMADAKEATRTHHKAYGEPLSETGKNLVAYREIAIEEIKDKNDKVIALQHKVELQYPRTTIRTNGEPTERELFQAGKDLFFHGVNDALQKFTKNYEDFVRQIKDTILYSFNVNVEFEQDLKNREEIRGLRRELREINLEKLRTKGVDEVLERRSEIFIEKAKLSYELAEKEYGLKQLTKGTTRVIEDLEEKIKASEKRLSRLNEISSDTESYTDEKSKLINTIKENTKKLHEEEDKLIKIESKYLEDLILKQEKTPREIRHEIEDRSDEIKVLRAKYRSLIVESEMKKKPIIRKITELREEDKLRHDTLLELLDKSPELSELILNHVKTAAYYLLENNNNKKQRAVENIFTENFESFKNNPNI